jgi:hypothetical protein
MLAEAPDAAGMPQAGYVSALEISTITEESLPQAHFGRQRTRRESLEQQRAAISPTYHLLGEGGFGNVYQFLWHDRGNLD